MTHTCAPEREHVDLGDGQWADLRTKLTHGQAQEIEAAQLVADYNTKGTLKDATAVVRALLLAAPEEWRKEHLDTTMTVVEMAMDQYETSMEAAVSSREKRQLMADATLDLLDIYARVFTAEWSFGAVEWPPQDGQVARILRARAQRIWGRWNKEMTARLKDTGADSEA